MLRYMTAVGLSVAAGVALFEVALVPALVVGGAVVLAPRYLPKLRPPRTSRRPRPAARRIAAPAPPARRVAADAQARTPSRFGIKQAIAKTVTFRVIVTTLDFTTNYVVIGELATAAGLSTFNLVAGPLFYLAHEAGWNYLGPSGTTVAVPTPSRLGAMETEPSGEQQGFAISRPLAKTITYRTIATVMDFTTNYVVVGDVATALGLSAFGFFLGPFVYWGHEKAWDYFGSAAKADLEPANDLEPPIALPRLAPAALARA
jgi:uncharacterized membrane protein